MRGNLMGLHGFKTIIKRTCVLIFWCAVLIALWPYLVPLKILVVFFHEASHLIAAILTGGEVLEFQVNYNRSGHVISRGGHRFITASAGYLGSLLIGIMIYLMAVYSRWDKALLFLLSMMVLVIPLVFDSSVFTKAFSVGMAFAFVFVAVKLPNDASDLCLRLIGLSSMLYVPIDIYADTIWQNQAKTDAHSIAEIAGGTASMWGAIWLAISIVAIVTCYVLYLLAPAEHKSKAVKHKKNTPNKSKKSDTKKSAKDYFS